MSFFLLLNTKEETVFWECQ